MTSVSRNGQSREFVRFERNSRQPRPAFEPSKPTPVSKASTAPRLYLEIAPGEGAITRLRAALAAARIEAVLLHPPAVSTGSKDGLGEMVRAAQSAGSAALITANAELARQLRADGVHLPWSPTIEDDYAHARKALGSDGIVGVGAGNTRHDAMTLGEAGADYLAFAPTNESGVEQIERVAWWAEIFEIPCVAMGVSDSRHAAALLDAGADFLGVMLEAGLGPTEAAARVSTIAGALDGGGRK